MGKGGKVLYSFVQENPADHAANEDILKVCSILLFLLLAKSDGNGNKMALNVPFENDRLFKFREANGC